jgi:mannose-6-phosphate isomerase-like protein (cupin superfamily)
VPFVTIAELPPREPRPGWVGRFFRSDHMTFASYEIAAGADVHPNGHPHEEVWNVLEGELELVIHPVRESVGAFQTTE